MTGHERAHGDLAAPRSLVRFVGALARSVLAPVEVVVRCLWLKSSPRVQVMGFTAACTSAEENCEAFFALCEKALGIISGYDPKRMARMRRDVSLLAISATGSSYYDSAIRGIFLAPAALKSSWPEYVAVTMVHEATHARLHRLGSRHYWRNRERHEAVCTRAEWDFVARVPNNATLARAVQEHHESIDWNRVGGREARQFVEERGWPAWTERAILAIRRLVNRGA